MSRILIVDDDPDLLKVASAALAQHCVQTALSAEEALAAFQREPFDVVICDLGLPGMQGLELVQRLRAASPAVRVLIISGLDRQTRMLDSLRENIVDYLAKPFAPSDLRTAVERLLQAEEAVEVVSATPQWIELRVPASFSVVQRLGKFFEQLHEEIDQETRESISTAFSELLNNAIEHGCGQDPERRIAICYLRLSGVVLYRIRDPGCGFKLSEVPHAAIANPEGEPLRHVEEREARGLRGGGFGILCARGIADELIFNEQGNEVVFARYLNDKPRD